MVERSAAALPTGSEQSLYRLLRDSVGAGPDKVYCYTSGGPIAYGRWYALSARLARRLCNLPLAARPVLAANVNDAERLLLLVWACVASGICLAFLPPDRDPAQARRLMAQVGAAALATDVPELLAGPFSIPLEIPATTDSTGDEPEGCGDLGPHTPAFLFQTSGTTGEPKWVLVRQGQFAAAVEGLWQAGGLQHAVNQIVYITPPLSHSYGLSSLFEYTRAGGAVVLPRGSSPLGAVGELLDPVLAPLVTAIEGVPFFYAQMSRLLGRIGLPALRHVGLGGGGLGREVVERIRRVYPRLSYSVRYGMTETPSVVSNKLFLPPYRDDWRSSGRVLPFYELRIVDGAGRPVASGEEGEIYIRGACLAWPYYGEKAGGDDFFATGDLGYLNADGELCVVGRKSLYLKSRGFRLSPEYVESVIAAFEGVQDCRVSMRGPGLLAEVVRADHSFSAQDLQRFLSTRLPGYAVPETVIFVQAIPRTPSGKIKRH